MKKRRNHRNKEDYKWARNEYVLVRREEEKGYEKDIVEKCKDEPKLFYRFINGKIKQKDKVERLKDGSETYEDPKDMSEILNKNFQQVFTKETEFTEPRDKTSNKKMWEIIVNKDEVYELMKQLEERKAVGPDGISGQILKECKNQLIDPIYDLIKCSVQTGKVPKEWKRADIVPIYKSGKKDEPLNYRPVSLTSIVCKICEKVIKKQWTKFLENKGILTNKQYGFRKKRSCGTNLLSFYSRVIDITQEREGWVDCVYLDLKKAFDKVPHERLLWKLENIGGLHGKIKEWMESYLKGREMRTLVRDEKSKWRKVDSGVPQGSVLAPILFLIYINDMPEGVDSYMSLFADDAKLLKRVKTNKDCEILQNDLNKIYKWSKKWEMEFNVKKCHVMEMGKSEKRPNWKYKMGSENIVKVHEEKDLGVTIQDNLQPEKHIERIFRDTYRMLRNIGVAFHYMDKDMMRKIIATMIRPKMEYAETVWSPYKKKHVKKLERIQRMATKMVPELEELTYEERLREINLPTLEERRERGDLITVFKLYNKMEEADNEELLITERREIGFTRGHTKKLRKGRCLNNVKKNSFPHRNIEVWNKLSEEVISVKTVHQLKEKLDKCRYGDGTTRV